jgi:hypothetical protein
MELVSPSPDDPGWAGSNDVASPSPNGNTASPPTLEQRLHLQPWTEAEIVAALEEELPVGWSAVRDERGDGVYYWSAPAPPRSIPASPCPSARRTRAPDGIRCTCSAATDARLPGA